MAEAIRDQNHVTVLLATSNADSTVPIRVLADPITGRLLVDANISSAVVTGSKSNNSVVPGATNLGVLPAVATASAPSYTETFQVALSTDLSGNLRTTTSIAANSSVNVNQIAGTATSVNNGTTDNGTQRVTLSSDSTGQVKLATGANTIGSLTANQSVNTAQINGVTPLMGNGVTGTGSQRVTIASDNTAFAVNPASATAPVSTMNSASANSGLNSAIALVFDDVSPTAITENSFGFARMSANRNQYMSIRDAAGNERGVNVNASNQMSVSIDGSSATNISMNLAQVNGITTLAGNGVAGTGAQRVTIASDNTPFPIKIDQTTPGTTNAISLAQIGSTTTLAGNGTSGNGAQRIVAASDNSAIANWGHGATAATAPTGATYSGALGATALPTAVSNGQMVGDMADKYGRQVALLGTIRDLIGTATTTISASTSETTIIAQIASTFNDIGMLIISNTSTATNTRIDFRDTTAGSIVFSLQSNGGQPPIGFAMPGMPIPQSAVNTNWTAQCASSTTDIRVYAVFAKNK